MAVHALIVPVGMVAQGVFPAPGGVGGADAAFGALYRFMGYTLAAGVLASLVYRAISWILGALGLLIYTQARRRMPETKEDVDDGTLSNRPTGD